MVGITRTIGIPKRRMPTELIGGGANLLLDQYPAAAAFSVHLIRTDYSDGLLRCRAFDSANTVDKGEADVKYDLNANYFYSLNSPIENLDSTAQNRLGVPAGGGDKVLADLLDTGNSDYEGFVPKWYEQTTNAHHTTQSTASNQPKLATSGQLETRNGDPAVVWTGDQWLHTSDGTPSSSQPVTIFSVGKLNWSDQSYFHDNYYSGGTTMIAYNKNTNSIAIYSGGKLGPGGTVLDDQNLRTSLFDSPNSKVRANGITYATGDSGGDGLNGITIGNVNKLTYSVDVEPSYIQELIYFDTDKSNEFEKIEKEINKNFTPDLLS